MGPSPLGMKIDENDVGWVRSNDAYIALRVPTGIPCILSVVGLCLNRVGLALMAQVGPIGSVHISLRYLT